MEKVCDFLVGTVVLRGNHRRRDGTGRFDGQRQRRHVEQQHVLHIALEHAALDGRADGDDFIRVHTLVRLLVHELARDLDDLRHAGHAADEHELIDLRGRELRVRKARIDRLDRPLSQRIGQLLQLGASQILADVLRAGLVRRDERQVDFVGLRGGKGDLRLFGLLFQALNGVRLSF